MARDANYFSDKIKEIEDIDIYEGNIRAKLFFSSDSNFRVYKSFFYILSNNSGKDLVAADEKTITNSINAIKQYPTSAGDHSQKDENYRLDLQNNTSNGYKNYQLQKNERNGKTSVILILIKDNLDVPIETLKEILLSINTKSQLVIRIVGSKSETLKKLKEIREEIIGTNNKQFKDFLKTVSEYINHLGE